MIGKAPKVVDPPAVQNDGTSAVTSMQVLLPHVTPNGNRESPLNVDPTKVGGDEHRLMKIGRCSIGWD